MGFHVKNRGLLSGTMELSDVASALSLARGLRNSNHLSSFLTNPFASMGQTSHELSL